MFLIVFMFSFVVYDAINTKNVIQEKSYSVLKLFTGFAIAAFIAWELTVNSAISNVIAPDNKNIHRCP
jgi:hypothetical protein